MLNWSLHVFVLYKGRLISRFESGEESTLVGSLANTFLNPSGW